MSREKSAPIWRSLTVWLIVTTTAVATGALASTARHTARTGSTQFSDLLVALCTVVLLLALAWLWMVTTVTVVELVAGRTRSPGGATRRLVLIACGAAVLAGAAAPAVAAGGDGNSVLAGLALPDRSVAATTPPAVPSTSPASPQVHVVRAGESLWSIAASTQADPGDVEARWRAIWSANRHVIGDDPDLILPGQQLRLPAPTHSDQGER